MITTIRLVITSPHIVIINFWWMRTFKIYPFSNFPIYNMVLTIVMMLYVTSPGLIPLITEVLSFGHIHSFPPPTGSGNHQSVLFL